MAGLKQSAITDEEWDIQSYTTYTPTSSEFVLRLTCITSFVEVESLTPDRAQGEFSLQRSFADTGSVVTNLDHSFLVYALVPKTSGDNFGWLE